MSEAAQFEYAVAVVGMAGRFPGARNLAEFWRNLRAGVESITFFSDEELLAAGCDAAQLRDPAYVKAAATLADVELFDAAFFGFTPREAELMDPQHRLFLEHAWAALEDAGYDGARYTGRIGVYAGESVNSYLLNNLAKHPDLLARAGGMQTIIGNDRDYLATHTAYKLNLKGPALSVQTSCSTSLVAVHLACQSLLNRECDMALAGGVSVSVPQQQGATYVEGGIIAPDGHCRAFDAKAQGTIKGSGVGVVVLKRLADALAEGDSIQAVIRGSAVNNDGSLKVGFTAPSVEGQAQVIEEALAVAGVEPQTVSYIEAHGTGTTLGDPIEIAALTQAFRTTTDRTSFCAVGALKTNIGHTDAAAGVAGLIKTVLALKHREIPPSLNFTTPNPNIDFANSPFYVNTTLSEWTTDGGPRRAGVSSFGIGGTNAHVIVEEAPAQPRAVASARGPQLLTLSAKTETALAAATAELLAHLKDASELDLADVAYTLQVGRREFKHRRTLVCRDVADAVAALSALDPQRVRTRAVEDDARVVFMFSGQGAQYLRMAEELYEVEPVFRAELDRCAELLAPQLGLDLRALLYPAVGSEAEAEAQLKQTALIQPALFAVEYALAQLWLSWGVRPAALIGHSIGEYVAACLAGVFSLEDALRLVAARGRLMQQMPAGAMLAVSLTEQEASALAGPHLSLAAVNGPALCVLSGPVDEIEAVARKLDAGGAFSRRLHVSHALHSTMMEPVVAPFVALVAEVERHAPHIPYVSTLTGTWITAAEATDPRYWGRHLRGTVRFAAGVTELLKEEGRVLLEVGPGQTLTALVRQQAHGASAPRAIVASLRHPHEQQTTDTAFILDTLAQLWLAGASVDWPALHAHALRRRTPLPTYPFERARYWIEPPATTDATADLSRKSDPADWYYVPSWKRAVKPAAGAAASADGRAARWLVFTDEQGLGAHVVSQLADTGADVTTVTVHTQFARFDERSFGLRPDARADYDALFKELRAAKRVPDRILHLWNLTTDAPAAAPEAHAAAAAAAHADLQARGFYSLIYLAQALGEYGALDAVRLGVVANGLFEVDGTEQLTPAKATLLGPCKVLPQEYPHITCRVLDVLLAAPGSAQEAQLARDLVAELTGDAPNATDATVAYRGRHRWVSIFEPLRLAPTAADAPPPARLRERGVYLLTGSLSDPDLALAQYLAETVRARLVFTGDVSLPERADWDAWISAHDAQDETTRRIAALRTIEAAGADVVLAPADISSAEQVATFVARVRALLGPINGVLHTAAQTGGGMMQLQTAAQMQPVLAPKIAGTLALQAAVAPDAPDFFALFSTSLSITGVFGQVDYCAANAFLDAFAHAHASGGDTFVCAINWHIPRWEAWQFAAVAHAPDLQAQVAEMHAAYGISLAEGVAAFARIISTAQPQVVVSTQDFRALLAEQAAAGAGLLEQFGSTGTAATAQARPDNVGAYTPPANATEQTIAAIWQDLFGIARIGTSDNFFDLGGNSLLAIQLISQLRKALEVELPLSSLFEHPTIAGLSTFVADQQLKAQEAEEIDRLLREIEALSADEVQQSLVHETRPASEFDADG